MSRKLNIDDLKLMVKDCVYEEENIVCMNNQYYRKLIKRINNLQSKIDKAIEYIENNLEVNEHDDYVVYLGKNENELSDILKEDK